MHLKRSRSQLPKARWSSNPLLLAFPYTMQTFRLSWTDRRSGSAIRIPERGAGRQGQTPHLSSALTRAGRWTFDARTATCLRDASMTGFGCHLTPRMSARRTSVHLPSFEWHLGDLGRERPGHDERLCRLMRGKAYEPAHAEADYPDLLVTGDQEGRKLAEEWKMPDESDRFGEAAQPRCHRGHRVVGSEAIESLDPSSQRRGKQFSALRGAQLAAVEAAVETDACTAGAGRDVLDGGTPCRSERAVGILLLRCGFAVLHEVQIQGVRRSPENRRALPMSDQTYA